MNKINKTLLGISLALIPALNSNAEYVAIHTPANFQIMSVSPNGKWACGVYIDATMNTYGFRWNLQGGSMEMLSVEPSTAWDVANDGTVSGDFNDSKALSNGAPVSMPGYWRDGHWHHVEMPSGNISDGIGTGISPDGRFMTGSICVNGIYTPYIWEEGKIVKSLDTGNHAVAYTVSPDGKSAGGYSTQKNRTACIWDSKDKLIYFEDSDMPQSPWNYARNFSPDGSKLIYWGGWHVESDSTVYLYSIYDLNTRERTMVKTPSYDSDLEFFDISNNGMLVGFNQSRGYIYANGQGMYIDDYLMTRNVDISNYDDFYSTGDYYAGQLPVNNVVAVSEDENVFALMYYNKLGQPASMILKLDQDLSKATPAEIKAQQLSGLSTVAITWKRPVGSNSIRGYNVYRDGVKINGFLPVNVPYYYDSKAGNGTHEYQISVLNNDGKENLSEVVKVEVSDKNVERPLSLYARQKGVNSLFAKWDEPLSNLTHKHYYDVETEELSSLSIYMPVDVEMGIRYDKNELSQYRGFRLSEVSFYPMSVNDGWGVNVYTYDQNNNLQMLYSQPISQEIKYGQRNTVKLDTPVEIPTGSDLLVAIEVSIATESSAVIGAQNGNMTPGYSDLLRLKTDDDFYSAYDRALENLSVSCISWAIDLGLENTNAANASNLSHYNVYVDGQLMANTKDRNYELEAVNDGQHLVSVEAVYQDGAISDLASTVVDVKTAYKSVRDLKVNVGDEGSTAIQATWSRPVDSDLKSITYSTDAVHSRGIKGVSENGYAFMAAVDYPASMVKGYDGYKVKSFKFYPLADAMFTFMLYENDDLIYELEVDEFTIGEWNEIEVPDLITINDASKYRLVVDCFDPEPDVNVLAVDNDYPRAYISELFSQSNGADWSSLSVETGIYGNWMMGMEIEDTNSKELAVVGYDVIIDNKVRNTEIITDTQFAYDFGKSDSKLHSIIVDTYYEAQPKAAEGDVYYFRLATAGIADGMITNITLKRLGNYLVADGADSITVYTTAGAQAAKAKGDKVNIDALTPGIYVVKTATASGVKSQKINIQK